MSDFEYLADEIYDKIKEIGALNLGQGEKMENIGRGMVDIECVKIEEEVYDDGVIEFNKYLNIKWQCDNTPVVKLFSEGSEVVDEVSEDCTTLPDGRIIKVDCWTQDEYSDSDGNKYLEQNDYIEEMASDFEDPDNDEDDDDF